MDKSDSKSLEVQLQELAGSFPLTPSGLVQRSPLIELLREAARLGAEDENAKLVAWLERPVRTGGADGVPPPSWLVHDVRVRAYRR